MSRSVTRLRTTMLERCPKGSLSFCTHAGEHVRRDARKLSRRCVYHYTFRSARSDATLCRRLICYRGVGRGCGVGRGLGVTLGVAVGVGVTVGVDVGVGVAVGVAVAVGVGVGVGWAPGNA